MKNYNKIILGAIALVGTYFVAKMLYKRSKTPDLLRLELSNLNNAKQSLDYKIFLNDRIWKEGSFDTRSASRGDVDYKNAVIFENKLESIQITGTSLDNIQFDTLVKFKKSKDPLVSNDELKPSVIDLVKKS